MKAIKVLIVATLLLVFAVIIANYFGLFDRPCQKPTRPNGVPITAKWNGGCDGGYWIDLVGINDEKYRFRIYLDYDSIIAMDADFTLADSCKGISIPKDSSILSTIAIVNEESILIRLTPNQEKKLCYLVPIYPAYGGETWEIIKEKGGY